MEITKMETTTKNVPAHWFDNPEIRTVTDADGNPWWVAKDVCGYFGDTHYRRSVSRLPEEWKGVTHVHTPGGLQRMTVISESGLYMLLFHMRPNKSRFKDERVVKRVQQLQNFYMWLCGEVIPSIRKHGYYITPQQRDAIIDDPERLYEIALKMKEEHDAKASEAPALFRPDSGEDQTITLAPSAIRVLD